MTNIITMKALFLSIVPLMGFLSLELFFDFEYISINGEVRQLNEFEGKKIIVILLPVEQTEDNLRSLNRLDSLSNRYSSQYTIVGIPSIEDGFTDIPAESLKTWYKSILKDHIILTAGMYTKKNSPLQHPLFRWLTNKSENMHFDEDVAGPGTKFFITEQGELNGVYSPDAELNEQLLDRMAL